MYFVRVNYCRMGTENIYLEEGDAMRHRISGYKLGRDNEHRTAMFRNMVSSFFEHGQIQTTKSKAKAVQPMAEKLITLAKRGDLHARRQAIAILRDRIMCDDEDKITRNKYGEVTKGPKLIKHLFDNIGPKFTGRDGGYTRIIKLGTHRIGDAADLVLLQMVGDESGPEIGGMSSHRKTRSDKKRAFAAKVMPKTTKTEATEPPADDVDEAPAEDVAAESADDASEKSE